MIRMITQLLVCLMLFFGVLTLFPKAFIDLKAKRHRQAIKYALLGILALFFSGMAFLYAFLKWQELR